MKDEDFNFIVKPELLTNISFVKSKAFRMPHRHKHCWTNHFISYIPNVSDIFYCEDDLCRCKSERATMLWSVLFVVSN
jgi:hypothetical protein